MNIRDEILAATIEAITKSEHVYVTTDKILAIVAGALLEHGGAIANEIEAERFNPAWTYTDQYDRGALHGLDLAERIARAHGQPDVGQDAS